VSANPTVTRAGVFHVAQTISELSARTLASGQARIDSHASGKIIRLAEEQSQRVVHTAQADLAQRAVERWLELLYDGAPDLWWNVREDGMVLKAPPWSRSRRRSYGLSEPQARLLRRIVGDLVAGLPLTRQLYFYLPQHQRWAINRSRFPNVEAALEWQRTLGAIKAPTWHAYSVKFPGGRL
jgi:hypothetical protein